jgi:alkylhydroperoxidase family enzyme
MKGFLTDEQRNLLQRTYKQIKDKRLAVRILCVLALDSGYTYQQIREIFFLDDATISDYKKRFLEGGQLWRPKNF